MSRMKTKCMNSDKNQIDNYRFTLKSNKQNIDIIEQILFCQNQLNNINISPKNNNVPVNKSKIEMMNENDDTLMVDIISNGYKYETSFFELNVVESCFIVSIISPNAFTIQLTRNFIECEEFFKNMNDYYNSIDDLQIPQEYLRKNLLCVTYDEKASAWNRSQIMEFDLNQDTVNVFFVDLNSWEENISRLRIRFILTKYSSRPVYVLTCRLASIIPLKTNQWNEISTKTFQNVVSNCQCDIVPLIKKSDNTFYVNLFAPHDEAYVCVNDFLIHCQMAKSNHDRTNEENTIDVLDDNGEIMHSIMAVYWKSEETNCESENLIKHSNDRQIRKIMSLTKIIYINHSDPIVFTRYNRYIMLPWFTISTILNESNEQKIKDVAKKSGFKPIPIDPLSHPLICSQILKLKLRNFNSTRINLYSIDCARKLFQNYLDQQSIVFDLLDRARLAQTTDDISFWDKPYETFSK